MSTEYSHHVTVALTDEQYKKLLGQTQMRVLVGDVNIDTWMADRVIIAILQVIEGGTTGTAYLKED